MEPLRILVVDDSGIVVMKLKAILRDLGHDVVGVAKTGGEALDKYRELQPDLVTMDITMPDMDGIEATKRILAEAPEALIMVVTSHGQEQMVIDAIDAGAKGYVLKPFNKDKMKEHISMVIEGDEEDED